MTFSHEINYAIKKSIVRITARFAPAKDCVLFVLLKLVFVALPSGTVWVDVPCPSVVSGVANKLSLSLRPPSWLSPAWEHESEFEIGDR